VASKSTSCSYPSRFDQIYTQGYTSLPDYVFVGQYPKTPFRDLFTAASTEAISLLAKLLAYDPRRRISAKEVGVGYQGDSRRCSLLNRPCITRISFNLRTLHTIQSYRSQNQWLLKSKTKRRPKSPGGKTYWTASKEILVPGNENPLESTKGQGGHQP